jgi:hypothetical protein
MKNLGGFLYVFFWCLAAALVVTIAVTIALPIYGALAILVVFMMAKSYLVLGNTWFFILWPTVIALYTLCRVFSGKPEKLDEPKV